MKIPKEWIEDVVVILKQRPEMFDHKVMFGKSIEDYEYYLAVSEFLDIPFNKSWAIDLDSKQGEKFRGFFASTVAHQVMRNMHPLTCGVGGGSHEILVPRIDFRGENYLICPTCGWHQAASFVPIMFPGEAK